MDLATLVHKLRQLKITDDEDEEHLIEHVDTINEEINITVMTPTKLYLPINPQTHRLTSQTPH